MENIKQHKLPIETEDIACVTDCWIYNRLIIIKTSPYYNDWIASHYNLFCKGADYEFNFGEIGLTEPNYHDDILVRKQINLFKLNQKNIVSKLSNYLLKGYYINIFTKVDTNEYHEVVIYGFDDLKECFLAVRLRNRRFEKYELSYTDIADNLPDVQKHFFENRQKGINLSVAFQQPATLFKLKKSYSNSNCAFEAYKKLRRELYGLQLDVSNVQGFSEFNGTKTNYTGVACLHMLHKMIDDNLNERSGYQGAHKIIRAVKKLHEHRKMILCSMEYIYDKWSACMDKKAVNYIEEYKLCCKQSEKWLGLALHFGQTDNKRCLSIILGEISEQHKNERSILNGFINTTIDWAAFNRKFI